MRIEAAGDEVDDQRRCEYPDRYEQRREDRQDCEDGAGNASRFFFVAIGKQPRVDRNKRGREDAFAEKILQRVGNPDRNAEDIGISGEAEVAAEEALANQSREAAE